MDEDILSLLDAYSPADLLDTLTNLLAPSICIQNQPLEKNSDMQKGSSRIGGRPDLPKGMRWPRYGGTAMSFLTQINLTDLANYDTDGALPRHGLLSFFFDEEYNSLEPSSSHSHHKGWLVHYFADDFSLLRHASPPASFSETQLFPLEPLIFGPGTTLPAQRSSLIDALHLSNDERERYFKLAGQIRQYYYGDISQGVHQMLGHPYALQGDVFLEAVTTMRRIADWNVHMEDEMVVKELRDAIQGWRLLLQIDMRAMKNTTWSGCLLYFLLPASALATSDFSQAWLVTQCD